MRITRDIFKKKVRLVTPGHGTADYEPYRDAGGDWRWRFKDTETGEIIDAAHEGWEDLNDCADNAWLILACAWRVADDQPEGIDDGTESD
jgi:uncharacterized protein YegP (UPF0339 family)